MICELLLILIIIILGCYVILTDLRNGIVENKAIALGILLGIIINSVYYSLFARDFFRLYIWNLVSIAVLAILLYARHYWAAGDSKLLICMTILIPGRIYDDKGVSIPGISYMIMIFLAAYLYLIVESIIAWIKKKKIYRGVPVTNKNVLSIIINYAAILCLLNILSLLWNKVFKEYYWNNQLIFSLLSIVLVSFLADSRLLKKKVMIMSLAVGFVIILVVRGLRSQLYPAAVIQNYVIVIMALLIRHFVNRYNYQEVATNEVQAGMVLAYTTVLLFQGSNIKDLPTVTSEDMRDRISSKQADAIRRWGKSKKGKQSIVILRKMPFAVFIVIGILLYIFIRMVL